MFSGVLASSSIKSLIRKADILIQVKTMKTELAGERRDAELRAIQKNFRRS
jgi:hypothetical protein